MRSCLELEFSALGPLQVQAGERVIQVGPRRQRAVLAILLLRANQAVSIPQLIDGVWGQDPPGSARRLVHTYMWQLRRLLGQPARGGRLVAGPWGYQLQALDGELDITRFEQLVGLGRAAIAAGDLASGGSSLRAALALWRGEPLEDVELHGDYAIDLARLAGQRCAAAEECLSAELACGRHHLVITEIEQLLAINPLRESLIALLMLALHRAGRRAEALEVFREAQARLAAELGLDPAAELCGLHQQILADDPALSPPLPAGGHPAQDLPRQLPAAVRHFAGRATELGVLTGLLDQPAGPVGTVVIAAIEGTPGIGKTALAVHFAHQAAPRFPDGQLYIDLRGFDPAKPPVPPAEAIRLFLHALAVPAARIPASPDGLISSYRSVLSGRRILVVLDNARDAAQVRPLIPGSSSCLVIITSRSQLTGLAATEAARILTLDLLTGPEARELLIRRLGAERVGAEPDAAEDLIKRCARLPLALSIVAARAAARPALTLAAAGAELRDVRTRLDALDTGDLAADTRAAFSWSYQNLSAPAARMFRLLGVHPGPGIAVSAAASLAGWPRQDAGRALAELSRANLVTEPAPGRYAFHDLLRAYAAERAQADDHQAERHAAMHRMLDHYLHSAHAATTRRFPTKDPITLGAKLASVVPDDIAGHQQALAWFEAEERVLLAAVGQAFSEDFDAHAWQIAWASSSFLDVRGAWHELIGVHTTALAAARRSDDRLGLAHACHELGYAQARMGRYDAARSRLTRSLRLFRQLGDQGNQARVLGALAMACQWQGQARRALGHSQQALGIYRAAGHAAGQAHTLNSVGWYHSLLGDHRRALACCRKALALHRELGDRFGQAATLDSIGHALAHLGEPNQAIDCYRQALDLIGGFGDRYNEADVLRHLAEARQVTGDPDGARSAWQDALLILDSLHHPAAEQVRGQLRDLGECLRTEGEGDSGERGESPGVRRVGTVGLQDAVGQDQQGADRVRVGVDLEIQVVRGPGARRQHGELVIACRWLVQRPGQVHRAVRHSIGRVAGTEAALIRLPAVDQRERGRRRPSRRVGHAC